MSRLSHSAVNKYASCPKEYELHYKKNLRSKTTTAALLFGTAIDAVFTIMLSGTKEKLEDIFAQHWRFQEINGEKTYIPKALNVVYSNSDFDQDLLTDEDYAKIQNEFNLSSKEEVLSIIHSVLLDKSTIGFDSLTEQTKGVLNFINWVSMYRKGLLMIETLKTKVIPNIEHVYGTQSKVELTNDNGDTILGFIDLVVKWKGVEKPVIFDLKTSARLYEDDSVTTSQQLALYVHSVKDQYQNTDMAGYIVLLKNIRKNRTKVCSICQNDGTGARHKTCNAETDGARCNGTWIETIKPEADVQIIIDRVPEHFENMVIENFDEVNKAVKAEIFPRNLSSCVKPWGKCVFYDYCHSGKDDGVVVVEQKDKR